MKKILSIFFLIILVCSFFLSTSQHAQAQETQNNYICAVYFTGVGCPHCAKTDPYVLKDWLKKYPNFVVLEYEIYQQRNNASLLFEYDKNLQTGLGIPFLLLNKENKIIGDRPILNSEKEIFSLDSNACTLSDGQIKSFPDLEINSLPGQVKIWTKDKILIKEGEVTDNQLLKDLLARDDLKTILENKDYKIIEPIKTPLSGSEIAFEHAIKVDNQIFQWNGTGLEGSITPDGNDNQNNNNVPKTELTILKIISLAAVDAVNPCAFAVLLLMLISILTYDPTKKKNVLWAGLSFIIAVFVMYLFYGLIIIRFFQIIQALTSVRLILYQVLAVVAIILGLLNLKDFIKYKPGGFLTEMPIFIRPIAKKFISGVTSVKGAFVIGLLVTLFLLPCTIGPYIICGGILCSLDLLRAMPYLLLYNLVFVLPMMIIVLIVYKGLSRIEDVSGWKDKNIRYLHLVSGLIMLLLGVGMILGWF
jgi:cytochrome c biogenesis protein CcdA